MTYPNYLIRPTKREDKEAVNKVLINATKSAKCFYQKMGFEAIGDVKSFKIRGIALECFDMEFVI